jgi:8-oxo-dGTP pyrophosphatase MutT (NUDIX family)
MSEALPEVIPAATVVVFRRAAEGGPPELLMVRRSEEMRFAGGAAVFPGGRVDPGDRLLAAQLSPDEDPDVAAAKIAGIRETLEETGLAVAVAGSVSAAEAAEARAMLLAAGELEPVLKRYGWQLALDRLIPFARWCPMHVRAFDTRFFLADLGTGAVEVAVDATEHTHLFWASAADALAMADRGEITVIFPTRRNLERLAQFSDFAGARAHAEAIPSELIVPRFEQREGERWLCIPDDRGYPITGQPLATARRG